MVGKTHLQAFGLTKAKAIVKYLKEIEEFAKKVGI